VGTTEVRDADTETWTDESGSYAFAGLEPGTYTVTASAAGNLTATDSFTVETGRPPSSTCT
jgi:protocatechuate 3,4-dioxygenase beta subunit